MEKQRTQSQQYWCHICQKKFKIQINIKSQLQLVQCPYCKQMATQLIQSSNHPESYIVYQSIPQPSESNTMTNQSQAQNIRPIQNIQSYMQNLLGTMMPSTSNNQNLTPQQRLRNQRMRSMHSAVSQLMNATFQTILANPQARDFLVNLGGAIRQNAVNFFSRMNSGSTTVATAQQINNLKKVQAVQECSICQNIQADLSSFQQCSIKKGYQLDCGHKFHQLCIMPWFQRANTCPTCRQQLK